MTLGIPRLLPTAGVCNGVINALLRTRYSNTRWCCVTNYCRDDEKSSADENPLYLPVLQEIKQAKVMGNYLESKGSHKTGKRRKVCVLFLHWLLKCIYIQLYSGVVQMCRKLFFFSFFFFKGNTQLSESISPVRKKTYSTYQNTVFIIRTIIGINTTLIPILVAVQAVVIISMR